MINNSFEKVKGHQYRIYSKEKHCLNKKETHERWDEMIAGLVQNILVCLCGWEMDKKIYFLFCVGAKETTKPTNKWK